MLTQRIHPDDLAHTTGVVAVAALGVSLVSLLAGLTLMAAVDVPQAPVFSESVVSVESSTG